MNNDYPKVLVIGVGFGTSTGSGITLTNLFKNWPADRLAAAAEDIDTCDSICVNNYSFGYLENKRRFPFQLIQKRKPSGVVRSGGPSGNAAGKTAESFLKRTYLKLLHLTGLFHYSRDLRVSEPFKQWVRDFGPDYIYTTANELEVIRLVKEVQALTGAKVITHIWDDLIKNYFNSPGLFYNYRKNLNNRAFKDLLYKSDLCLCISAGMQREYYNRYGRVFKVYHNCLNLDEDDIVTKTDYRTSKPFTILYAGRVGMAISECLNDVCKAIGEMEPGKYEFRIQTTSEHYILSKLKQYPFVKIGPKVEYREIPAILASADLLLLPYNFDHESVESLKLSMPTKLPEYMISGTPILLYSHKKMYVTDFAVGNRIAHVVSKNGTDHLIPAIELLYSNEALRRSLADRAIDYARRHFNADKTRENFTRLLTDKLNEAFAEI